MMRLYKNSTFRILLLFSYYFLTVLPHEEVGTFINSIFKNLQHRTYDLIIAVLVGFISLLIIGQLYKKIKKNAQRKKVLFYILLNLVLVLLCFQFLFVVNIEAIHFFQYAVFSILCFSITKSYNRTLLISSIAGFLDEIYQYLVLAPEKSLYFDFNDVVIDIVGVGIGLTIVKIIKPHLIPIPIRNPFKLPEVIVLLLIILSFIFGFAFGYLSVLQDPNNPTLFTLLKEFPKNFWTIYPMPYIKFHILRPLEGIFLITILWLLYSQIGKNKNII